ncbi:MAG: type II toxin-antitoxin system VapB family antitoxin [Akkermansiaceae bacterium]|nr:type II toxin-antitoxin system VapB family antitoxin [Akkermansiaceae bacterium]
MKTTLEIDDDLYREAKAMAALTGRKMKDLVSEGLERVVRGGARSPSTAPRPTMRLPLVPSSPGKAKVTSEEIYDLETSADLERR